MSRPKNDRKFQSQSGKTFQGLDAKGFVTAIAVALKAEFGATPSALKTIAQLTRSNERAVRNWLEGKNGPSGSNLVVLMRHSDRVLRTVLELADRRDLALAAELTGLCQRLLDAVVRSIVLRFTEVACVGQRCRAENPSALDVRACNYREHR